MVESRTAPRYSRWGHSNAERGRITSFDHSCLMHLTVHFAFLATKAYCWILSGLLSTRTSRSVSAKLLSSHLSSSLYLCPVLFQPRCRIHHFPLLSSMLLITQCSNISRSLRKTSRSLHGVKSTSWFSIICKFSEIAFHSSVQIIDKNVQQDWP